QVPFLRRSLGIVFQDFELLMDRSVNENLDFVMKATGWKKKAEIAKRREEVLDKVGLATKGYKMPHELSGGEQQRVVVARALLNDPHLILADEPTGNLDPVTTEEILQLLSEISKNGRAIVMATHDYSLMKDYSTRIIKCENNRLVEEVLTV
ncbi:MAG: ATP-binding cassette domain-containing protein, partial [Flavobacteriales bacterium]|nr:ATP-binding cassette domain-containing protein [Flavobacteriales bacterium]